MDKKKKTIKILLEFNQSLVKDKEKTFDELRERGREKEFWSLARTWR